MTNNELYRKIDAIVENHKDNKPIVAILQDVQEEYRYIPREAFDYLAEKLDVSLASFSALQHSMRTSLLHQKENT